jgi:hypothetical protein
MRAIIHDPMYKALHTVAERRAAFEKYVASKRQAEQVCLFSRCQFNAKERERERVDRLNTDFKQMLVECADIKPFSRFSYGICLIVSIIPR